MHAVSCASAAAAEARPDLLPELAHGAVAPYVHMPSRSGGGARHACAHPRSPCVCLRRARAPPAGDLGGVAWRVRARVCSGGWRSCGPSDRSGHARTEPWRERIVTSSSIVFFFLRHTVGGGYSMICSQTTQYCPFEFWWWSLTCCRYYYSLSLEGVANYCVLQNENAPRILATILHYCNPILFMSFMASLKHENLPLKKETREFYYINCTTWISSNSFYPAPFDLEIR